MPRYQRLIYSVLSGILLSLSWYKEFSGLFLLIAMVPLLIVEDYYFKKKSAPSSDLFWYSFLCFFLWNIMTTWWIGNATFPGAIAAIVTNSFLFSIVFWIFHFSKKVTGIKNGYFYLPVYWIAFEYLYLNAEISWPWLNLGNGFSGSVKWIQWYEYTGTLGGTFWILIVNLSVASILIEYIETRSFKNIRNKIFLSSLLIIMPIAISYIIYYTYKEDPKPYKIAIIQPNIDPYKDKFKGMTPRFQIDLILKEAAKSAEPNIDYFVGPETAIQGFNSECKIERNWAVQDIQNFLKHSPKAKFVIGAETSKDYLAGQETSATARKYQNNNFYYDVFNSALQIDTSGKVQIYHKSKLVIGVEKMPFMKYLHFLEKFALKLGGTYGSLATQNYRGTFTSNNGESVIAPVICYESIYGEYVNGYIRNNANLIFVITNDGWWGNTPGHQQHLNYSRLRAIETRRSIARSANTGISAFINQRGDILKSIGWWKRGYITYTINANDKQTFYVKYGDYSGKIALDISLFALGFSLFIRFRSKT